MSSEIRTSVFDHIAQNANMKNIWVDTVGGHKQHVHCLISLGKDQTISEIARLIKGESSFWINQNKITQSKFGWQDDYWAVSVSESQVERVRKYINGQEEHHRTKTFEEEVSEFMEKYGWKYLRE